MLKSKKHVFWEALLITLVVFILGFLIGVSYEAANAHKIDEMAWKSEIDLNDIFLMNSILNLEQNISCETLINSNLEFANKIYNEAKEVERLEQTGRVTELTKIAHRRYDLLRTFLWINSIKTVENCPNENFSVVIYLYELETEDLTKKAIQNVWSRVLLDLKEEKGDSIVLIPIAADSDFISLNVLISNLNISDYPVVVINGKHVIKEITSVQEIEKYLL